MPLPPLIATHFYLYATCAHRVALDLFGDRSLALPDTQIERALKARGLAHEAAIAAARGYPRPDHGRDNLALAFQETLALMREGHEGIYQGVLLADDMIGMPDLLLREPGPSALGDYRYTVGDVKISRRARSDQALQVAFYAHLLGLVQGVRPERLLLLLGDGREEWFPAEGVGGVFDQALADLLALCKGARSTEPFLKPACAHCPWRAVCLPALEAADDLSLVPGMTPARRTVLRQAGVGSVSALAASHPDRLSKSARMEGAALRPLVRQAAALVARRPLPASPAPPPPGPPELLVTAFEDPSGEGRTVLVTVSFTDPREGPKTAFLWALTAVDEKELYEKTLRALARKPQAPVYHYGPGVPSQIARMESRYGADEAGLRALHRLVDVARLVRRAAAVPVRAYALRETAEATGYAGPAPEGDTLLDCWKLEEGDEGARERMIKAAHAEREALRHLLDWLRRGP